MVPQLLGFHYCSPRPALRWRRNECDSVSNHQPHGCLLNRLFGHRWQKTSKLRVTGLCVGNSPETGEFPAQMASNAENVSIWWRHHGKNNIDSYHPEGAAIVLLETRVLTLEMRNFLKNIKDVFTFYIIACTYVVQQKKIKFTMEQPFMLSILYCQYHACWCLGRGINWHGIDQVIRNSLTVASKELKSSTHLQTILFF